MASGRQTFGICCKAVAWLPSARGSALRAPGHGHSCPRWALMGTLCAGASAGLAKVCSDLHPPPSTFPSEFFVLLLHLSIYFTGDPRDPASPTCPS